MINKRSFGYTLVELSAVVAVLGLVAGTALSVVSDRKEHKNVSLNKNYMEDIEEAIAKHVGLHGFLPCPASPTSQENSADFGRATDCDAVIVSPLDTWESGSGDDTIRGGVVPVRTLNLPDKYMYDQFGSRISYVAIKKLATTSYAFDNFTTSLTTGVIQINDINGNQINEASSNSIVAYALISHGKDKKGAYAKFIPSPVATREVCGFTAIDSENCDNNDSIFIDSWIVDSKIAANYYYDQVRWHGLDEFFINTSGGASGASGSYLVGSMYLGRNQSCALGLDGIAHCWGQNNESQIGDGTTVHKKNPVVVSGGHSWKSLSNSGGKGDNSCGIKNDNAAYCWGKNDLGEGGDGTLNANNSVPQIVAGSYLWKRIASGANHSCGIQGDDTIWCWGDNVSGQLGDGTTTDSNVPVAVSGGGTWKSISMAWNHSCGIKSDDTLWCWGDNGYGQLGDNTTSNSLIPLAVSGGGTWKFVAGGARNTCGIKSDDTLWCWGNNFSGLYGDSTVEVHVPTVTVTGGTWKSVDPSLHFTCAIKSDDTLWCWGGNSDGQLGNGTNTDSTSFVEVSGGSKWIKFASGERNACAIKDDNTLWCWGWNFYGQLGDGTQTDSNIPVAVAFP